jgi:hypothetical protein
MQSNSGSIAPNPTEMAVMCILFCLLAFISIPDLDRTYLPDRKVEIQGTKDSTDVRNTVTTSGVNKSASYHEVKCKHGYVVGSLGAANYVLNEDSLKISKGYHSFSKDDGGLYGILGANIEKIDLKGEPMKCSGSR